MSSPRFTEPLNKGRRPSIQEDHSELNVFQFSE